MVRLGPGDPPPYGPQIRADPPAKSVKMMELRTFPPQAGNVAVANGFYYVLRVDFTKMSNYLKN